MHQQNITPETLILLPETVTYPCVGWKRQAAIHTYLIFKKNMEQLNLKAKALN